MKPWMGSVLCSLRQSLAASRAAHANVRVHKRVAREVLCMLAVPALRGTPGEPAPGKWGRLVDTLAKANNFFCLTGKAGAMAVARASLPRCPADNGLL